MRRLSSWPYFSLLVLSLFLPTAAALATEQDSANVASGKPQPPPPTPAPETFWSFRPIQKPGIPGAKSRTLRNPIDYFIASRLEAKGLQLSPEAARAVLLRRLSFDLTGLPPTPAEIEQFSLDRAPDAFDKVVDRLLVSP